MHVTVSYHTVRNTGVFKELLHPIDQFGRLTNPTTFYLPIGQCPHNWSISPILTNSTKTNVLFRQLDLVIVYLVFCLQIEMPTYI